MLRPNQSQTNFFTVLYDRIPEDHLLKRIAGAVDSSFINELVADSYCTTFGRPAKEPELMAKLCILERLYNLSDVKVIEETNCNLAYLWFLGLNPDDPLPDPSLLAKFRTQRLKDISLDEILTEIVRQCVEKGIIKGTTLAVDATHTEANCKKQVPERIMKHLAAKIFAALKADHDGRLPDGINANIPDYKDIEDHKEAKRVMKEYLEQTVKAAEPHAGFITKGIIEEVKDILSDEKFILQKGLRSLVDTDARVGYKSKTEYNPEKKYNVPTRIVIGQQIRTKPEWMLPNEKYEQIFSEAMKNMTEEEREAAAEYIATRGEFRTLQVLFDQMYYEFQAQARRDPHEIVNEYKVEKINRVLDRLMELMEGKNYAVFLERVPEPQTESGEDGKEQLSGLNYGDVSLLLTQFKGAITRYSGEI